MHLNETRAWAAAAHLNHQRAKNLHIRSEYRLYQELLEFGIDTERSPGIRPVPFVFTDGSSIFRTHNGWVARKGTLPLAQLAANKLNLADNWIGDRVTQIIENDRWWDMFDRHYGIDVLSTDEDGDPTTVTFIDRTIVYYKNGTWQWK